MAIDISKIENLLIDEGTEASPFILRDNEITTLYQLAVSNNPKITIKGYVNTTTGTILRYQSYQIKKAWPDLHVLAQEVSTQDWTLLLLSSTLTELEETRVLATNISTESLNWAIDDVSLSVTVGSYGEQDVRDHLHFENSTGRLYYDAPTSNAGWIANIRLKFWPTYIEEPTSTDYRILTLVIRAIAVTSVTITAPSRIDESATTTITLSPYPANNTKSLATNGIKYSLSTTYGLLSPSSGERTDRNVFTFYAPTFDQVPWSEDEGGKYYNHSFTALFYMFNSTTPSGTAATAIVKMQNAQFSVTCDKSALVEGEDATFTVIGYEWVELQKTFEVDETTLSGITEAELRERVTFDTGGHFSMYAPTDNATFHADITIYIAPPGADPTGSRAVLFPMSLTATGISSLTFTPQTIGQNIPSIITFTYKPTNHTKGTLSFGLVAPEDFTVQSRDNVNGIYKLFCLTISTAGHDVTGLIYSSYLGTTTPLVTFTHKIYVQDIYFNVGFDESKTVKTASITEGNQVQVYVDILHLSELKKEYTVSITKGADLITSDWVLNRLHFSEDVSTDKIWFDSPQENISWEATITIRLIAKYVPEGTEPPYSQTISVTCSAVEVTGIEWQYDGDNYRIVTSPYRKGRNLNIKTLPYNNTKEAVLLLQETSPYSIGSLAAGLTMNQTLNGTYLTIANTYSDWFVYGFLDAFSSSTSYGTVTSNKTGTTTQTGTPTTTAPIYPKHLTFYDKLAATEAAKYIEFRYITDDYRDLYVCELEETETDKTIIRKVGKLELSTSTEVTVDTNSANSGSVGFSIIISDKTDTLALDKAFCSHFAPSSTDISPATSTAVDTFNNCQSDQKFYFRISNSTIGVDDYTEETAASFKLKIDAYISALYDAGTPITVFYPLAVASTTTYNNTLYYNNIFFKTKAYHIYTANNPDNQCSIEFINNATTGVAQTRYIFGTEYPLDDEHNKAIEAITTTRVRADEGSTVSVPFFAGTKASIDQYDEDGNLLVKADGTAEKGEVTIWENFSGKFETWEDTDRAKITWDLSGETTVAEGTPTPSEPIYPVNKKVYTAATGTAQYELKGYTWSSTWYGDTYNYSGLLVLSNIGKIVLEGTENITGHSSLTDGGVVGLSAAGMASLGYGKYLCSHLKSDTNYNWQAGHPNTISSSGTTLYLNFAHDVIGTSSSSTAAEIVTAVKTYLAALYAAGTPVTIYYPKSGSPTIVEQSATFYITGSTHCKYTISKLINEDDTEGDTTATNNFNHAFVYDKDGTIPDRFFISRFIPGWNQDDNTSTISMASGLKSQLRTITKDIISSKGCYYLDDEGLLKLIEPIYYGPLLAYTWLSYLTYGTINLKNSIGLGASKIGYEALIFADDARTLLTPGQTYATLYILNNGLLDDTTYLNYDFNIIGVANSDEIATAPITSYKIRSVTVGGTYTAIELGDQSGAATTYKAKNANDFYSLNSAFSLTGYSERTYKNSDDTVAVSGFGTSANKTKYNDNRHPVRCLNVENMWGGGDYAIEGTGFVADEEDDTIIHPIMWNPEYSDQDINDMTTWEEETDINALQSTGTWDIGSVKYKDSHCAWPIKPAGEKIPYRGYNVYNRPTSLGNSIYNWVTGNYNDWSDTTDYQSMCGLGHTHAVSIEGFLANYKILEYIHSVGKSWIDTGVTYNASKHKAMLEINIVSVTSPNNDTSVFGPFNQTNNYTSNYSIYQNKWRDTSLVPVVGEKQLLYVEGGKGYVYNDVLYKNWGTAGGYNTIYIGRGRNQSGLNVKLYSYKLYENGTLKQNMIPVMRKSDSKTGMYDTVNNVFYSSITTTDFTAGPDIDNNQYYELEKLSIDNKLELISVDCGSKLSQKVKLFADLKPSYYCDDINYLGGSLNTTDVNGLNLILTHNKLYLERNVSTAVTSATGSSTQTGTPTPTNMIPIVDNYYYNNNHKWVRLRSLTDATDSYSSGTITRNVGVITLTGNETFTASTTGYGGKPTIYMSIPSGYNITSGTTNMLSNAFKALSSVTAATWVPGIMAVGSVIHFNYNGLGTTDAKNEFVAFLRKRYNEGNPVVIYAPLTAATTETVTLYENPDICLSGDTTILTDTRHTIEVEQTATALTAKIDEVSTYSGNTVTLDDQFKYCLFAINDCDEINYNKSFNGTIYSFKLYKNGKLIRNYVPTYNRKDELFGLYDLVNKKFSKIDHTNPTIIAPGLYKLDYICNTTGASAGATPYIRLGSAIMASDVVEIEFSIDSSASLNTFCTLFGAETTSNDYACRVYITSSRIYINNAAAGVTLTVGTKYLLHMEADNNYVQLASGGTKYTTSKNTIDCSYAPDVFCLNRANSNTDNQPGLTVYSIDINGEEYIPAYKAATNLSGLYNTTSKVFYPSIANGDFVHEAVTQEILANKPIDYITFSNGQYIDTDWNYTPGSTVKVSATKSAVSANPEPIFGNEVTDNMLSFGFDSSSTSNRAYMKLVSDKYTINGGTVQTAGKVYNYTLSSNTSSSTGLVKGTGYASATSTQTLGPTAQSTTCLLGTSRASDGSATTSSISKNIYGCQIYEGTTLVRDFQPVYNLVTDTYGMFDSVNERFYENYGSGILSGGYSLAEVEYILNTNGAYFSLCNFDTGIFFKDTGKIVVDMTVDTASSDTYNKCINGSTSVTAAGTTYLCYSSDTASGVTLTERTVDGSVVTWKYTYNSSDYATVHISGGSGASDTGRYKYKKITVYGTDGITVLGEFIPVRFGTTGGFYDTVTGQTIFNQNSIAPTYGADIDNSLPGDPGLIYKKVSLLTRIFGTL